MKRFREWLRVWLGIKAQHEYIVALNETVKGYGRLESELAQLRLESEIAQLRLEIYQPPQQVDIPKIITKCRTFKQFTDAVEREMQDKE